MRPKQDRAIRPTTSKEVPACKACGGAGRTRVGKNFPACPACKGTGKVTVPGSLKTK